MKVVCCKNCGAKYRLNDDDYITSFECPSCAGDLEFIEHYPNKNTPQKHKLFGSKRNDNSIIVRCSDCGLKYNIKPNENILDYECDSCGGSLEYLNSEKNKELKKRINQRKVELSNISDNQTQQTDYSVEEYIHKNSFFIRSVTDRIDKFFSEEEMSKVAEEELEEKRKKEEKPQKTAKTVIPSNILSKYSKEFSLPRSNNYGVMKNYLKDEFFKGMNKYYLFPSEPEPKNFLDKIRIKIIKPQKDTGILSEDNDEVYFLNFLNFTTEQYIVIVASTILILSIIEFIFINQLLGFALFLIALILIVYIVYKRDNTPEYNDNSKILRDYLLTLPEDYYVFYNVKIPVSPVGINHVVVGPTGIYAFISHKYDSSNDDSSKNVIELIRSFEEDSEREKLISDSPYQFRYSMKQRVFSKDNQIKQKTLSLCEDLINFLNENNIGNCFVEPMLAFVNNNVVVINTPLTDDDLFIDELLHLIKNTTIKLNQETIDKCAVLLNKYSADCSFEG